MSVNSVPRTIVRNAAGVFTGLAGQAARYVGDIVIEGDRVAHLGPAELRPGDRLIDASGCVVYPGLVSTHHHLLQSLLKGVPAALNAGLKDWLLEVPFTFWSRIDETAFRTAARIGIIELLLSGVTTIADHHYIFSDELGYDPAEILFDTADALGPRFVLCRGGSTQSRRHAPGRSKPTPAETSDAILKSVETLTRRYHDASPSSRRKVALAPANLIWSMHPSELREMARAARTLGIGLHSHLSEDSADVAYCLETFGLRPVQFAGEHEFLGPDVWFAHLVHVDDSELSLLRQTGTGMAHCPQSNCRLGSGVAPAPKLSRMGGRVGLGVDGAASNEACDMISEMHTAWYVHRAVGGPGAVFVEEVVRWASAGGADLLGFEQAGRITPGALADLAIFDLSHPRYAGLHDPLIGPVACGGAATVRHLLVGGKPVVANGQIPGVDFDALAREAARIVGTLSAGAPPLEHPA